MSVDADIARWREALPEEIFDLPVFLLWKRETKPGRPDAFDKIPFWACGRKRWGTQGRTDDRLQLVTLGDALAAYSHHDGKFAGVGMALLPDVPIWALDLDRCIKADGRLSALAQRAVDSGTYAERSPSGRGIRALFTGKAGVDAKNRDAGVETFDSHGFVTLTGDRISGETLLTCAPDLLAEILRIVRSRNPRRGAVPLTEPPPENPTLARSARLPLPVWRRLSNPYPSGCDRSAVALSIALQLKRAGLTPEQALEVMSAPDVLEPALDRRGGDIQSARQWMWRYCVTRAYEGDAHGR